MICISAPPSHVYLGRPRRGLQAADKRQTQFVIKRTTAMLICRNGCCSANKVSRHTPPQVIYERSAQQPQSSSRTPTTISDKLGDVFWWIKLFGQKVKVLKCLVGPVSSPQSPIKCIVASTTKQMNYRRHIRGAATIDRLVLEHDMTLPNGLSCPPFILKFCRLN